MQMPRSMVGAVLALGCACTVPAAAHAAVLYDEIVVRDALGSVLASVTATPADIAADPDAIYYVSGIATDPAEHGNFGIVVDGNGDPFEIFGAVDGGPDGNDLGFALQGVASGYFVENPQPDSGVPIDMTIYLDPALRTLGDTASFISSGANPAVPEPLTWAMMVVGFAAIGHGMRRRPVAPASLA